MALDLKEFHPALRDKPQGYLALASSSWNFFWPVAADRINWYGDVQLRCREQDYQDLIDNGPPVRAGNVYRGEVRQRRIIAEGQELDDYRAALRKWLEQFP